MMTDIKPSDNNNGLVTEGLFSRNEALNSSPSNTT